MVLRNGSGASEISIANPTPFHVFRLVSRDYKKTKISMFCTLVLFNPKSHSTGVFTPLVANLEVVNGVHVIRSIAHANIAIGLHINPLCFGYFQEAQLTNRVYR